MKRMAMAVSVAVVLMVALLLSLAPTANAQNTKCYMERGGLRWICGDGGTMLFRDGSTLTMESGSTLNITGFLTTTIDELTVNGDAEITGTATIAEATITEATVTTATVTAATLSGLTVNGNAAVTGTLDVDGQATVGSLIVEANGDVTGNWEVTDHLLTQAELYLIPPAALVLEDSDIITPTAAVMEITAASEVTVTLATAGDGQVLILVNTSDQTINIAEDASLVMANAAALGEGDTLMLVGVGVIWYELSRSNN